MSKGYFVKGAERLPMHFASDMLDEVLSARRAFPGQEETLSPWEWFPIIDEEVGEVARELNERLLGNRTDSEKWVDDLYAELIQIAAMAGRMALSIRNSGGRISPKPSDDL